MINLQITNKLLHTIIFILIIIFSQNIFSIENKILFKISNESFTTADLNIRKKYLLFVGDNYNLSDSEILEDFISANIFYKYYLISNQKLNIKDKIDSIFKEIIVSRNISSDVYEDVEFQKNIKYNLELDLIRKSILENFLDLEKVNLINIDNDLDLIYNYKLSYLNVYLSEINEYLQKFEKKEFKNLSEIKMFLEKKKIDYSVNEKKINTIKNLNQILKNKINEDNDFFILQNGEFISIVMLQKEFVSYDGLNVNLYSIKNNEKLNENSLKCENLQKNFSERLKIKEYEYVKLNNNIKNNLLEINDYIEFKNENSFTYVILCSIKFNKEILSNINLNQNINSIVTKIERNFIKKYSKIYNLYKLYE